MSKISYIQVILPLKLGWEAFYSLPEGVTVLEGDRVEVIFASRSYVAVVSSTGVTPPENALENIRHIAKKLLGVPPVSKEEIAFWRQVSQYYLCTVGEVYKAAYPAEKSDQAEVQARRAERLDVKMAKLEEKLAKARNDTTRERYRMELESLRAEAPVPIEEFKVAPVPLSLEQASAADAVRKAFEEGKTVLLDGVTGSGKTEIYLNLALEVLASGRSVLYLVPEIALSGQLQDRVRKVFPSARLYNSSITSGRRLETAEFVRSGNPYLVLGTRSSLFLPHRNLGLVIVDEEHDTSYKQDSPAPRYHARETAIMLAGIHGANVIMGSATPSLESLYNSEIGIFRRIQLKQKFHSGEDASVMIVDTVAERRKRGMVGDLSRKLLFEIQNTLEAGEQVLLLRSRRSYAPALQCEECGTIPKCPSCNVSLSLHKNPDRLVCHYCGRTLTYTGTCHKCGGALKPLGAGTQKIEEEIQAVFPSASIARLDSDNAAEESAIIKSFAKGEIDILIGTQIITKGFDFPNLTLVGVIQADNILAQHDFRADERAFQLLEQFRGRSGRRGKAGRFVIQTREPGHPVFAKLSGQDALDVSMLEERRQFGYPPYTRLIHIVVKDSSEKRLDWLSRELASAIESSAVSVTGPFAPAVDKVAGKYIRQLRMMLPRDRHLKQRKQAICRAVSDIEKRYKYAGHIIIDVDPV